LWGFYFFRFAESNTGREVFNRSLAGKIADVHSPVYRFVIAELASTHVVPRAYIWGFADPSGPASRGAPTRLQLSAARISERHRDISSRQ
jgi:hypothetical protein